MNRVTRNTPTHQSNPSKVVIQHKKDYVVWDACTDKVCATCVYEIYAWASTLQVGKTLDKQKKNGYDQV
jgi:hypothetical protein